MRPRPILWFVICLLCLAGAFYSWRLGEKWAAKKKSAPAPVASEKMASATLKNSTGFASTSPLVLLTQPPSAAAPAPENQLAYRLSNTARPLNQLVHTDHALLLENALLDTDQPATLAIPAHLRAGEDPGSYIVQSRRVVDKAFRDRLRAAGAEIVAPIPNNAFLVRATASVAQQLAADAGTQTVLPWEPYYKLKSSLLKAAVKQEALPEGSGLNLVLFADAATATKAELLKLGAEIFAEERTPFGPVVRVKPPAENWYALATLPGVQTMEWFRPRTTANDLSRVSLGVASDTIVETNYLGLTGAGVLVNVNDSGVDATHPDLAGRVTGDFLPLVDLAGHGTHVAGIIAGSGLMSTNPVNVGSNVSGSVPDASFRGLAPEAKIFALPLSITSRPFNDAGRGPDTYFQERAAQTNALISNNSWHYANDNSYDIAAASYDAAVRDALPGVPGSQPVLFVFAAGNAGRGNNNGLSGAADTVQSPGTAKNVITLGAIEQPRNITNVVLIGCTTTNDNGTNVTVCTTNQPWLALTSDEGQVASFSSRGNVGVGIEGEFGRFKPDLVAPGTFVVSTRSSQWNEQEYYNPTNHHVAEFSSQTVAGTNLNFYSVFVPENAVGLNLTVISSRDLPIYVWPGTDPSTVPHSFVKTNVVNAPPDGGGSFGPVNTTWWYAVGNSTAKETNTYILLRDLITTNDLGNYFEVLSNLNNSISGSNATAHYYRYESGTSMSAAEASGTLALMQQFFEQRLHRTNSPALMKALLINGARSVGTLYNLQVSSAINYQGWGLVQVRNSLPGSLSNFNASAASSAMWLVDQSPATALATGQSQTRMVKLNNSAARNQPLRVSLVWTDPPGSPAAAVKLVNDLDLIVTNLDSGDIFHGNHIEIGSNFSVPWDTNLPPPADAVNNVENVYLFAVPGTILGTNYSVTVRARHVNVNAVTAHPDDLVQDYALVISSGDGAVPTALTVTEQPLQDEFTSRLTFVENSFSQADAAGFLLDYQRVGANTPLLGTTNGMTNQWHFYVITNSTSFTNAAFVTFIPADLSIPRIGVRESSLANATRAEADIDLYVSTDPNLTNLSPAVIAAAYQSRSRGGTEQVILSNAVAGQSYYLGVKSEDQMAAEYSLFGVFSQSPFDSTNGVVRCFNLPQVIPDRSPDNVVGGNNVARVICPCALQGATRRVIVTNTFTHEHFADLIGNVAHGTSKFAVLNNHRTPPVSPVPPGPYNFIYEDNGERNLVVPPNYLLLPSDGPESLRAFVGEGRSGPWIFTFLDNSLTQTGRIERVGLQVELSNLDSNGVFRVVQPASWTYDAINVPVGATNLTVCVAGNTGPVELYLRKDAFPTQTDYDKFLVVNSPGGCLSLTAYDLPPLSPGRYFVGVFNASGVVQNIRITARMEVDPRGVAPIVYGSTGNERLIDDAVANSSIFVTNHARIATVEVNLRIDHPRVSDLAITLISPSGTRVLLSENRGMTNGLGMGTSFANTNVVPVSTSGGPAAVTNFVDTGRTSGSLTVDYNFFDVPDRMTIYYENALIYDTGLISGTNRFNVNYGPGASTQVMFVMNQGGSSFTNTSWNYTVSDIQVGFNYLTFTENSNRTTTPIKFALPPFINPNIPFAFISGFEPAAAGDYVSTNVVDGWDVLSSNRVSVLDDPLLVHTGAKSLALLTGEIRRTLATSQGRTYRLDFAYRKPPNLDPIHWWPAEDNTIDIVGGYVGQLNNGAGFATGMVGRSFSFDGVDDTITYPIEALLTVTNSFTMEFWARPTASRSVTTESTDGLEGTDGQRYAIFPNNGDVPVATGTVGVGVSVGTNGISVAEHNGFSLPTLLVYNASISGWTHIAVVYQNRQPRLYVNGVLVRTGLISTQNPCPSLRLGGGGNVVKPSYGHYRGEVDEYAIFDRILSDAQIKDIYGAGAAGKCGMITPPTLCVPAGAQVFVPGLATNVFGATTTNWVTNSLAFTATASGTPVGLAPLSGAASGVLLDDFTLTAMPKSLYYLPEESLSVLVGENAFGEWKLELWDSRTGATNTASALRSWQLGFVFQNTAALAGNLTSGPAQTNTISPGQIASFIVDVPAWATFATNRLIFATGPLNVLFNQSRPPGIGATNAGDYVLFGPVASGSYTLSTAAAPPPPLLPGQRYFIGVHNPGTSNVTYAIRVDFDITALTNAVPVSSTLTAGTLPRYFSYDVSSSADSVSFQLLNLSGNANLVARKGMPLPTLASFDYAGLNPGTNDESILVLTNSTPVALSPGRWYLGVFNADVAPVNYTILATEQAGLPGIITLTNGIPYFNTNSGAGNATDYYRYVVTPAAARAQFEINGPTADVTLVARKGLPLPDLATFDYRSANAGTNDELIVVFTNSAPVALTPGDWYLAAVNLSGAPATYAILATEWSETGLPIVVTGTQVTGTNFCLTWNSLPGAHYYLEGLTNLSSTIWVIASPTITAVTNSTTWCVPLPSPFQFFRVRDGLALRPASFVAAPPVNPTVTAGTNGFTIAWTGGLGARYQVQWTPLLFPPAWTSFTNIITSATAQFSFLDDGAQTGGLGALRFYRPYQVP